MVAQCIVFLLAGFDTVQTTLTWAIMELVKNPHVQERLIDDILEGVKKHGQVDYDSVQDMTYLDAVVKGKKMLQILRCSALQSFPLFYFSKK